MNNIKLLRRRSSVSQQELAGKVGVTQQAVAKWETGKSYPRGETLVKLASVLGCTIDELFGQSQDSA